jgi:hypothetical protein
MARTPEARRVRRVWFAIVGGLVVALVLAALIKVERRVAGACLVHPASRWTLIERSPGSVESRAIDIATNETLHYRLYQFKESFLDFDLPRAPAQNGVRTQCEKGDLVARVSASSLDLALAERRTELEKARATLNSLQSGSKPEEVQRARVKLERAIAARETFRPTFERDRELNETGVVSDSQWEATSATFRLRQLDVELAQSELSVLESGARLEDVMAAEVLIESLSKEYAAVNRVLSAQDIYAPIRGFIMLGGKDNTLVTIASSDSMVAEILVPQRSAHYPQIGDDIRIDLPGLEDREVRGTIVRVDRRAMITGAGPFIRVYGIIPNIDYVLEEGMEGRAWIFVGRESVLDMISGDIASAFEWEFALP